MKSFATSFLLVALLATPVSAQVIISSKDMFNSVGQYYKMYVNKTDTAVTSATLGSTGGPQSWDFTMGPTDEVLRFDYVKVDADGHGADFPKAKFAERKTTQSDASQAWLFLDQAFGSGRINYGFYEPQFNPDQPSVPFTVPIIDFPDPIKFGDTWSTSTSYKTALIGIPVIVNYSSSATADAWGIVNSPGIGFGDCLRVNELAQYDQQADLFGDGNFQTVATTYLRNYYWIREGHGIVAQIISQQGPTPPPDSFNTASQFARMFELSHPDVQHLPEPIKDLRITLGKGKVLLNWSKPLNTASFTVQVTPKLGDPKAWLTLTNGSSNFLLDSISTNRTRFYRIISN